jgi:hypothetical protein
MEPDIHTLPKQWRFNLAAANVLSVALLVAVTQGQHLLPLSIIHSERYRDISLLVFLAVGVNAVGMYFWLWHHSRSGAAARGQVVTAWRNFRAIYLTNTFLCFLLFVAIACLISAL